jgi:hypothetical protein
MAINVTDGFKDLMKHVGHDIECVTYGDNDNVAIECVTCDEILLDFDADEDECVEAIEMEKLLKDTKAIRYKCSTKE